VVIDRESDRVREILPPIPGRRWIVGKVADGAMTVLTAIAPHREQSVDSVPLLPCVIVYRNVFGRRSSHSAGLFAATVVALVPEACDSLLAMAARQKDSGAGSAGRGEREASHPIPPHAADRDTGGHAVSDDRIGARRTLTRPAVGR
jgi:hypothetical protein